jgi:hypothetical protein
MARKHITQATKDEKGFIHGFIRAKASLVSSGRQHFEDRATERHFTLGEAVEAVKTGLVVEVHNDTPGDVRALVRDSKGTCVVLSLKSWQVITVYYNDPTDTHDTLNWAAYRWNQNLVTLVKELRRAM